MLRPLFDRPLNSILHEWNRKPIAEHCPSLNPPSQIFRLMLSKAEINRRRAQSKRDKAKHQREVDAELQRRRAQSKRDKAKHQREVDAELQRRLVQSVSDRIATRLSWALRISDYKAPIPPTAVVTPDLPQATEMEKKGNRLDKFLSGVARYVSNHLSNLN
ncbi:hypothetical protein K469DRAFT_78298 [Zopfia rhizophila CBS 207.26]|uniref:BZIP domain-containing protein n=1 Tax=Zopfia rhizophila CBS 207.26 TaxID=1314779 RepID=A0A6A6DAJ3_9PEZI|nr:hypothetical protein K469DRAFT_78298 [Zopfia rhizophila CBS 207.26]